MGTNLEPTKSATAAVYRAVLEMVLGGTLPPGSKINQAVLAEQLGVSRTPLVKALHLLESQGLVDSVAHKGFTVHTMSTRELLDLWSAREAVETLVTGDLAEHITAQEVAGLRRFFEEFASGDPDTDPEKYAAADRKFHNTLLKLCRNELARRINEHFQILTRAYVAGLLRPPSETLPEHMTIIDALERHDREAARLAMSRHLGQTRSTVQDSIERLRKFGIDVTNITVDNLMLRSAIYT